MQQESLIDDYIRPLYPLFILVAAFWLLEVLDTAFFGFWSLDQYGIHPRELLLGGLTKINFIFKQNFCM